MPIYFPQLSNATITHLPYAVAPEFNSVISEVPTAGSRYTYAKLQAPLGKWMVNFQSIHDADLAISEAFFVSIAGRLNEFTLLDPGGNLCQYSEDFTNAVWTKSGVTVGSLATDPFGGNFARSIVSGTDGYLATVVLPSGGASGMTFCGSVWVLPSTSGQAVKLGFTDPSITLLGFQNWDNVPQQWSRFFFTFTVPSAVDISFVIAGLGGSYTIFGAQVAPLVGPGAYAKSPGNYGLHSKCRFDTDSFDIRANEPNSWALKLPIVEHA